MVIEHGISSIDLRGIGFALFQSTSSADTRIFNTSYSSVVEDVLHFSVLVQTIFKQVS